MRLSNRLARFLRKRPAPTNQRGEMGVRFYLNKRKGTGNDPVGVALVALRGHTQIKVLTPVKVKLSE